jgi:hypothetical protein
VNNITRIAIVNQLSFKVVVKMSDILNRVKQQREELTGVQPDSEPLKKAEIIAAARLGCAYYGIKKKIEIEKEIDLVEVRHFEAEFISL